MLRDHWEIGQIVVDPHVAVAPDLVVARGWKLDDVLVAPWAGFILKNLPVSGAGSGVRRIPGQQQRLGTLVPDPAGQPLADARVGSRRDRGIGKARIPVNNQAQRSAGSELLQDEG